MELTGNTVLVAGSVATNLLGLIRLTFALLPHLRTRPRAAIVMVSSGLACVPLADTSTRAASNATIHSCSQALRRRFRGSVVEVIELTPPFGLTGLRDPRQASRPMAKPLVDLIAETMEYTELRRAHRQRRVRHDLRTQCVRRHDRRNRVAREHLSIG